jgi:beta-glucosidase
MAGMPKYRDESLSIKERVDDLVGRMTLEEKVSQMLHYSPAIERLGVPEYNWWNECLHGVARAGKATVFPQAIGMAATFNTELIHTVASAISDEARAKHHEAARRGNRGQYFGLTFWTPNINIFRDPRWGRGHETYGEDPYLTSRMGVEFVKGLQGNDHRYLKLVATPKHFAVHSGPEIDRHHFDAVVSQRDLRETYLPAFKACILEGKAESVMGAYNRTNGEPCCGSRTLLQKILREEWGFDGYVVSDCWAICDFHLHHKVTSSPAESAAMAVKNGCDLNCGIMFARLLVAVDEGLIMEGQIDVAVKRLFTARFRLGMFDSEDKVPYSRIPASVVGCKDHVSLALKTARESIVMLKNQGGMLPLNRDKLKGIAIVGPNGMNLRALLGNYNGFSENICTPVEGIVGAVSPGTQVSFDRGCELAGPGAIGTTSIQWSLDSAEVIVAVLGLSPDIEGEQAEEAASDGGGDKPNIILPGRQLELLKYLCSKGKPVVLVVMGGSCIDLSWADENVPAIIMSWYPGEQGGKAIADVLMGDYNPGGRLPVTFYSSQEQLPPFSDYNMKGRTYRFMDAEPLYRFGFGLSYTTFEYSELALSKSLIARDEPVTITATVCNSGLVAGDEVAQLYVRDVDASVPVPRLHLEGFSRVHLKPGEKCKVSFVLKPEQLAAYDDAGKPFVEPGEFVVSVGGGQPRDPRSRSLQCILKVV